MDNCIFCKIASHQIPGKILYEDDVCMAFLDLSQTTNGHTLVIPKNDFNVSLKFWQCTFSLAGYIIRTWNQSKE